MRQSSSDDARRNFRRLLNDVEHGEHVEVMRYGAPAAFVVPPGWYEDVDALLAAIANEALGRWRLHAAALREGRQAAGLKAQDPRVVHHIDGDPRNNNPSNLRIVDPKENEQ
jgi:antitoxin (DNA-binding transcriptional repressor) of toxin-antitoxin stability system